MSEVSDRRSQAVIVYLGSNSGKYPSIDDRGVIDAFGDDGWELLAYAKSVVDEMDCVKIDWSVNSLDTAVEVYRQETRARHPELSEAAIGLLGRAFSFWWR